MDINFHETAVLEDKISGIEPSSSIENSKAQVSLQIHQPDYVRIESESDSPGLIILSDAYYPGWIAKLDRKPVKIYRANYLIRAIPVPAGIHQIEYFYHPQSYKLGIYISLSTLILIIILFTGSLVKNRLKFKV